MDLSGISEWVGWPSVMMLIARILVAGQMGYGVRGEEYTRVLAKRDE